MPKVAELLHNDISLILSERQGATAEDVSHFSKGTLEDVLVKAINLLKKQGHDLSEISVSELAQNVLDSFKAEKSYSKFDFFSKAELSALENLASGNYQNPYNSLSYRKESLEEHIEGVSKFETQIEELKSQVTGSDYSTIKSYEENEAQIKELELTIKEMET